VVPHAFGLDGLESRRSGELSGGQAQRVALARGLVAEPEVLCSPTSRPGALDSMSGELVMNLLVSAVREQGHGRPGHPPTPGSPRTPTAEVVVRTARSARSPGEAMSAAAAIERDTPAISTLTGAEL